MKPRQQRMLALGLSAIGLILASFLTFPETLKKKLRTFFDRQTMKIPKISASFLLHHFSDFQKKKKGPNRISKRKL